MLAPVIGQYAVLEDSAVVFMARILGADGAPITQATVSEISYTAWDLNVSNTVPVTTRTVLTTSDVIYNTLSASPPWTADEIGRNLNHTLAGTAFPNQSPEHEIEYKIVPDTTALTFYVKFKGSVHEVYMA